MFRNIFKMLIQRSCLEIKNLDKLIYLKIHTVLDLLKLPKPKIYEINNDGELCIHPF